MSTDDGSQDELITEVLGPCLEAARVAFIINKLAESYESISGTHFLPMMNQFQHLLSLDPKMDQDQIVSCREEIRIKGSDTEKAIADMIHINVEQCSLKVEEKRNQLNRILPKKQLNRIWKKIS